MTLNDHACPLCPSDISVSAGACREHRHLTAGDYHDTGLNSKPTHAPVKCFCGTWNCRDHSDDERAEALAPVVEPEPVKPTDLSRRGLVKHISGLDDETIDRLGGVEPDPFEAKLQRQRDGIADPIKFERGVCDPEGAKLLDGTTFDDSGKRVVEPEPDEHHDLPREYPVDPESSTPSERPGTGRPSRIWDDAIDYERARVRQIIKDRMNHCRSADRHYFYDLLTAIDEGETLMNRAVRYANASPGVEVPRIPGEDNRCADCRTNDTDCTGKCEAYS